MSRSEKLLVALGCLTTAGLWWFETASTGQDTENTVLRMLPFAIVITGIIVTTLLVMTLRNLRMRRETLRELNAMRRLEVERRKQENQQAVENTVTPVMILNGDRRVLFANAAAQRCFGFGANEMVSMLLSEFVAETPQDASGFNAKGRTKSGATLLLDMESNTWMTSEGALRVTSFFRDVTQEVATRNTQDTTSQDGTSHTADVMSAVPFGLAFMDEQGRFLTVNPAFSTLTGRDEADLLDNATLFELVPTEDLDGLLDGLDDQVKGRDGGVYTGAHRLRHAEGNLLQVLFSISSTYDASCGHPVFVVQTADITDEVADETAQSGTEVADADVLAMQKAEQIASAGHEMRARLTSVNGVLGMIDATEAEHLSPTGQRLLKIARANTDGLRAVLSDTFELSAEKETASRSTEDHVDMTEVATQAAEDMSIFVRKQSNHLYVDVPDQPLWVAADPLGTKQVLFDLISTACEYADDDTEVRIKVEAHEGRAMVYVQNTGAGITPEHQAQIFETPSKGQTNNNGLYLSKNIVTRQGGDIGLESVPGSLTVFWFSYPLVDDSVRGDAPEVIARYSSAS
ncbi:MAG: PAS domain S-box protein [Sulfitobacter sp.]